MKKKVLVLLVIILAVLLALGATGCYFIPLLTGDADRADPPEPSEMTGNNDVDADNVPSGSEETQDSNATSDPKNEAVDVPEDQTGSQTDDQQTATSEPVEDEQPTEQETQSNVDLEENMTDKG